VKPDTPINALEADQPGDPGVTVPHQIDPDLDDMDASPHAADLAIKTRRFGDGLAESGYSRHAK
jgi:hypothetical protein